VAIVYRDSLFAEGLASLLRTEGSVEVLGVIGTAALTCGQIRRLGPAVVILEGDPAEGECQIPLEQLLATVPYVVEVSLDRATVAVHQRARIGHSRRFVELVARLARRAHSDRQRRRRKGGGRGRGLAGADTPGHQVEGRCT